MGRWRGVSEAQARGLGSRQIRVSWAPAGSVSLSMGSSCGVMREKEPARASEDPQLSGPRLLLSPRAQEPGLACSDHVEKIGLVITKKQSRS